MSSMPSSRSQLAERIAGGRSRVGGRQDDDAPDALAGQEPRRDESVAAVVAGTRQDQHLPRSPRGADAQHGACDDGDRRPSLLHQRIAADAQPLGAQVGAAHPFRRDGRQRRSGPPSRWRPCPGQGPGARIARRRLAGARAPSPTDGRRPAHRSARGGARTGAGTRSGRATWRCRCSTGTPEPGATWPSDASSTRTPSGSRRPCPSRPRSAAWARRCRHSWTASRMSRHSPARPSATLLRAWGGLGYPRRAMALRDAAREIVSHHGGRVPRDVTALMDLPGVGPYTARAVAAIAYGVPVTALDVNARRVLGRVLGRPRVMARPPRVVAHPGAASRSSPTRTRPSDRAADWNHALMDLGATVCRPIPECRGVSRSGRVVPGWRTAARAAPLPSRRGRLVDGPRPDPVPGDQSIRARTRPRQPPRRVAGIMAAARPDGPVAGAGARRPGD